MSDEPEGKGSREQVAFELMAFIARNFEPDPYDARDFTLRLYEECLEATRKAQTGHGVALELVKAISSSGKDPRRGAKPDRKYVLALFEECLGVVHDKGSREASAAPSASSTPSASSAQSPSSTSQRTDHYTLDQLRARSRSR